MAREHQEYLSALRTQLGRVILGKPDVIENVIIALNAVTTQENLAKQSDPFGGTLDTINSQDWPSSEDPRLKNNEMFKAARDNFDKALKLNGSFAHHRRATDGVPDGTFSQSDR